MSSLVKCVLIGCRELASTKGLCEKHYKRKQRHGDPNYDSRPKLIEGKSNKDHPLYRKWRTITRKDLGKSICLEWKDFIRFVQDVGEIPSKSHSLRRRDVSKPYSPDNYYWAAPLGVGEERKKVLRDRMRIKRELDPEYVKSMSLKKNYGITIEEYNELSKSQNGVCKICGNPEGRKGNSLSVDHCHSSGTIRGLLCHKCNGLLGLSGDSIRVLEKAIDYLKSHGN